MNIILDNKKTTEDRPTKMQYLHMSKQK